MLSLGTDCSGIETPSEGLTQLGVPFRHAFASEKQRTARRWLLAKWQPERVDSDVGARDHQSLPSVDLYVAGAPCVEFSGLNVHRFDLDSSRTLKGVAPLRACLAYVAARRPKAVVLEGSVNELAQCARKGY